MMCLPSATTDNKVASWTPWCVSMVNEVFTLQALSPGLSNGWLWAWMECLWLIWHRFYNYWCSNAYAAL